MTVLSVTHHDLGGIVTIPATPTAPERALVPLEARQIRHLSAALLGHCGPDISDVWDQLDVAYLAITGRELGFP